MGDQIEDDEGEKHIYRVKYYDKNNNIGEIYMEGVARWYIRYMWYKKNKTGNIIKITRAD